MNTVYEDTTMYVQVYHEPDAASISLHYDEETDVARLEQLLKILNRDVADGLRRLILLQDEHIIHDALAKALGVGADQYAIILAEVREIDEGPVHDYILQPIAPNESLRDIAVYIYVPPTATTALK